MFVRGMLALNQPCVYIAFIFSAFTDRTDDRQTSNLAACFIRPLLIYFYGSETSLKCLVQMCRFLDDSDRKKQTTDNFSGQPPQMTR